MIYIILNKQTHQVITDHKNDTQGLQPETVYTEFDASTMLLVHSDLPIVQLSQYYDNIDGHFHIETNGLLREKNLQEKADCGAIDFALELLLQSDEYNNLEGKTPAINLVSLGLQLNLLKTLKSCKKAFGLLDEEIEQRFAIRYSHGKEMKLLKNYVAWIDEEKPTDDNRPVKYQKMQDFLLLLKQDYSELRQQLKALITPLEAAKAKARLKV
ncbi:MAG: hypothetical protein HRT35_26710 [Algicola sp.]|nr:hypothetical protein [Algicola sp.]